MLKSHVKFHSVEGKRLILIADDEQANRALLGLVTEDEYDILYAEDGEETLRLMRENAAFLSLVLLDLNMPKKTGFDVMEEASKNGFTLTTHLYSGMSGVHIADCKRHAGAIEAGLCLDALCAETICDGVHLPDGILRLIYKCKGRNNIILTSDASRGSGLPEGTIIKLGSLENGLDALILNGVANRPDMKAFAGSVASGDRLIRTELNAVKIPMWEVMGMATANPARLLGIDDKKGKIAVGYDADLAVFTKDIYTRMTVVNGEITYEVK